MRIELMIYIYGAICVSTIVFNCACILVFKGRTDRLERRSRRLERIVRQQYARIAQGETVEETHLRYLDQRLTRVNALLAFDETLERLETEDAETAEHYLYEVRSVFLYLAVVYWKREAVQSAYFAHFLAKHHISRQLPFDSLMDLVREYLKSDSLYCRQNAMRVLYSLGDAEQLLRGLHVLDKTRTFFHTKILADGLLTFEGDADQLIRLLWQELGKFSAGVQTAILDYIRFRSGAYQQEMLDILVDERRDPELHYAAIRYLGKYPYPPARALLQELALETDRLYWQSAAISAAALASYPGDDTLEVLKRALTSSSWHVRYNAAQSIDSLGISYWDLMDIMSGDDRYAREMMTYQLHRRQMKEATE